MPFPVQNSITSHGVNELFPRSNMYVSIYLWLLETKTIDFIKEKVYDFFFYYSERDKLYFSGTVVLHKVFQMVPSSRNKGLRTTMAVARSYHKF